jgi:hypothetical protein
MRTRRHTALHMHMHCTLQCTRVCTRMDTARAQLQRELDAKCREFTAEHASPVMRPRPTGWQRDSHAALPQTALDGVGRAQAQAQAPALPPPLSTVAAAARATAQAQAAAARLDSRLQPLSALPPPAAPSHVLPPTRAFEGEAHAEGGDQPSSSSTRLGELRERLIAAATESRMWLKRAKVARDLPAALCMSGCNPTNPGCNPTHPGCNPTCPGCNPTCPGCSPVHPRSRARGAKTTSLTRQ